MYTPCRYIHEMLCHRHTRSLNNFSLTNRGEESLEKKEQTISLPRILEDWSHLRHDTFRGAHRHTLLN
jgi:hypothetical protein